VICTLYFKFPIVITQFNVVFMKHEEFVLKVVSTCLEYIVHTWISSSEIGPYIRHEGSGDRNLQPTLFESTPG